MTAICTTVSCYIDSSIREAGAADEIAATPKTTKYSNLSSQHTFYSIAVETLGPLNEDARLLLSDLGRRILAASGDLREVSFLFQRISVVVQRFNAVLLHSSFVKDDQPE